MAPRLVSTNPDAVTRTPGTTLAADPPLETINATTAGDTRVRSSRAEMGGSAGRGTGVAVAAASGAGAKGVAILVVEVDVDDKELAPLVGGADGASAVGDTCVTDRA
jgi:hypothetical protein